MSADPRSWDFYIRDVPDDAAAVDVRARVARAAAAAGIADLTVLGRPDKDNTYWACHYLVVRYVAPEAAAYEFEAALIADGIPPWRSTRATPAD